MDRSSKSPFILLTDLVGRVLVRVDEIALVSEVKDEGTPNVTIE